MVLFQDGKAGPIFFPLSVFYMLSATIDMKNDFDPDGSSNPRTATKS